MTIHLFDNALDAHVLNIEVHFLAVLELDIKQRSLSRVPRQKLGGDVHAIGPGVGREEGQKEAGRLGLGRERVEAR